MVEYILKKPYACQLGTLQEGGSIRVMTYNGKAVAFYDGGMVDDGYGRILLNLINDPSLHEEYLFDRNIIVNKA